jgi:hypothetical protein
MYSGGEIVCAVFSRLKRKNSKYVSQASLYVRMYVCMYVCAYGENRAIFVDTPQNKTSKSKRNETCKYLCNFSRLNFHKFVKKNLHMFVTKSYLQIRVNLGKSCSVGQAPGLVILSDGSVLNRHFICSCTGLRPMLWSQFSAIFANLRQTNWRFSSKNIPLHLKKYSSLLQRQRCACKFISRLFPSTHSSPCLRLSLFVTF